MHLILPGHPHSSRSAGARVPTLLGACGRRQPASPWAERESRGEGIGMHTHPASIQIHMQIHTLVRETYHKHKEPRVLNYMHKHKQTSAYPAPEE
eukprot:1157526-Pelagomonas_calceolata.AAC.6